MSSPLSSRSSSFLRSGAALSLLVAAIAAACSAGPSSGTTGGANGGSSAGGTGGVGGTGGASVSSSSSGSSSSSASSSGTGGIGGTGGTGGVGGTPCAQGTIECVGTTQQICDGNGGYTDVMDCAPGVCVPDFGCATCLPGSGSCMGNTSTVCKADGSGFDTYYCEPNQGVTCDPNTGQCVGACAPQVLGQSFVGCDYYPTVTANVVAENPFHFAVVVSNTTGSQANVKITQGVAFNQSNVVAANSVAVITLPWVSQLKNASGATVLVTKGAYRLQSDQPVTVYQYNPLEYTLQNQFSYTNDASLLLPVNTWTGNYRAAAYKTFSGTPGFYAITASQDNTTVTVAPPPVGGGVQPGAGIAANGTGTITMNQGDVIEVLSASGGGDVTGALITADKPVQVIGGHMCTFIPDAPCCCDHIEESVPPLETLSTTYIVTAPLVQGNNNPVAEVVRIVATAANTTLTYDPAQPGAPTTIAQAGGFVELPSSATSYQVTANNKIIVAQYMEGQFMVGQGDPAMTLAVPTQQYRTSYLFHAPTNYEANYVNVTAPTGAAVTLDGAPVAGFQPIGGSGYSVARVSLSNAGNGTHSITGATPFGIAVYGYGQYTSYWYPGGQNLQHL